MTPYVSSQPPKTIHVPAGHLILFNRANIVLRKVVSADPKRVLWGVPCGFTVSRVIPKDQQPKIDNQKTPFHLKYDEYVKSLAKSGPLSNVCDLHAPDELPIILVSVLFGLSVASPWS